MKFKNRLRNFFSTKKKKDTHLVEKADLFLVSYPKSGNTWLRFLLSSYFSDQAVDFYKIAQIIPDLHMELEAQKSDHHPLVIKTHSPRIKTNGKKVIHLIRDGRDVAVSYFFHLLKLKKIDPNCTFISFLKKFNEGQLDGFGNWGEHTEYVLKHHENTLLVKYEVLLKETTLELKRIINYCGIPWDEIRAQKAIEQASFTRMQKLDVLEHDDMLHLKNSRKDIRFVRNGIAGEYKKYFSETQISVFNQKHNNMLYKLGYEIEESTP